MKTQQTFEFGSFLFHHENRDKNVDEYGLPIIDLDKTQLESTDVVRLVHTRDVLKRQIRTKS